MSAQESQPNEASEKTGFHADDRERTRVGTIISVLGGVVLAGVKALGFFLRALFGGQMWGLYAIAWSLMELLAYLLVGGFNDAVVIFSARIHQEPDDDALDTHYAALGSIIVVPFMAALVVATGLSLGATWVYELLWSEHDPFLITLTQQLAWALPLLVLVQVPVEATRSSLRFGFAVGVVQVAFPILSLLGAIGLYYTTTPSILAVVQGTILALLLCLPVSIYAFSQHFDLARTFRCFVRNPFDREVLSFAMPQSLNMMLSHGLNRVDALMLSFLGVSANAIGVYALVSELTQLIRVAKMAFSGVFSPLVAKYRAVNNRPGIVEALDDIVRKTSSLSVIMLLVAMSVWPLLIFEAGEHWDDSTLFPWLLCAGPLMSAFFGLCGNTLLMFGHSRWLLFNAAAAGTLNLVLNLLFIPMWGLEGAALATGISSVTVSCMQIVELAKFEAIRVRWTFYSRTLLAALPVVPVVFWLTAFAWPTTGDIDGESAMLLRTSLAITAALVYVALQIVLPGRRPFGPVRSP